MRSAAPVNDGRAHRAVLTFAAGTQSLTVDGAPAGSRTAPVVPLDMTFNQLGTGLYAASHGVPNASVWTRTLSAIVPRIPAMSINLFSQIGLVLLVGLVTKNSILLVEFANQRRAHGTDAKSAMLEAGQVRLRPILMTSFTLILGILPIAIGFGAGAESRRPMGVAILGGMFTSTFLTLIVVPIMYTLLNQGPLKPDVDLDAALADAV